MSPILWLECVPLGFLPPFLHFLVLLLLLLNVLEVFRVVFFPLLREFLGVFFIVIVIFFCFFFSTVPSFTLTLVFASSSFIHIIAYVRVDSIVHVNSFVRVNAYVCIVSYVHVVTMQEEQQSYQNNLLTWRASSPVHVPHGSAQVVYVGVFLRDNVRLIPSLFHHQMPYTCFHYCSRGTLSIEALRTLSLRLCDTYFISKVFACVKSRLSRGGA